MKEVDRVVRFLGSDGGQICLALPESFGSLEARRDKLERVCEAICSEWLARDRAARATKGKARKGDLERACYQLIVWCLEGDGLPYLLERRAQNNGYKKRRNFQRSDIFQLGLDAVFPRQRGGLTANQRKRLTQEMWFAFRHYIPDILFTGFVHQSGGSAAIERMGADHILDEFQGWIIEKRTEDGLLQFARGTYPPKIQRAVRARRRDLASSGRAEDLQLMMLLYAKMYDGRRRRSDPKGTFDPARPEIR